MPYESMNINEIEPDHEKLLSAVKRWKNLPAGTVITLTIDQDTVLTRTVPTNKTIDLSIRFEALVKAIEV